MYDFLEFLHKRITRLQAMVFQRRTDILILVWLSSICSCRAIIVFHFENQTTTNVNQQLAFATLKSQPPELQERSFTICGSMYLGFLQGRQTFFSMRKGERKDLWFSLAIFDTLSDGGLQIAVFNSSSTLMNKKKVVLRFHDWFHACVSVDSNTGQIVAVVNGVMTHDFYSEPIQSSTHISFKDKLLLGLTEMQYGKSQVTQEQSNSPITNVNIFSGLLNTADMKEQTSSAKCANGTYLKWIEMEWAFEGSVSPQEIKGGLCESNPFHMTFIFPTPFPQWKGCVGFCPKVQDGGRVPFVRDSNAARLLMNHFYQTSSEQKLPIVWNYSSTFAVFSPYWLKDEAGFVDYYNNSAINPELWFPGQPNGGMEAPLAVWNPAVEKYLLFDYGYTQGTCMCQFDNSPILTLRGLCEQTDVDKLFVLKYSHGDIIFKGIRNSKLTKVKDSVTISYQDRLVMEGKIMGTIPYPIGKLWLRVTDNAISCNEGKVNDSVALKLTACPDGYFTCDNGECIAMEKRCDQLLNCDDETDEVNCEILLLKPSYRKMAPPSRVYMRDGKEVLVPAEVSVSIFLLDVAAIKEPSNEIDFKFKVMFQWLEFRAFFQNLKKSSSQNTLDNENVERLWIPDLVYENNKDNDDTRDESSKSHIKIIRKGNFTCSGTDEVDEIEVFKGSENPIVMVQSYTKTFKCRYELRAFPFDTQVIKI